MCSALSLDTPDAINNLQGRTPEMSEKLRLKRGQKNYQQMYGKVLDLPKSSPLSDFALKCFFGEVLTQNRLSPRDRRLLILGSLAGLGADASLVEIHTRAALGNDEIKVRELDDILLLLQNYVGFPRLAPLAHLYQRLKDESATGQKSKDKRKKA
jgi:4-carboxymuconolactone decarboxylase